MFALVVKVFCGHVYLTDLIGQLGIFVEQVNREGKSRVDSMNRRVNWEKKRTKLSVSNQLIESRV